VTSTAPMVRWRFGDDACAEANEGALRRFLAFLVEAGIGCSSRARIAGATAELLENVARHAPAGRRVMFCLEATLERGRLRVEVSDNGVGFDPAIATVCIGAGTLRSGLARARALAENLRISSRPGHGASVELQFSLGSPMFADERGVDLSDHDYMDPALSRRVLTALQDGAHEPPFHLPPALAVCVGRLLSARSPASDPLVELWS